MNIKHLIPESKVESVLLNTEGVRRFRIYKDPDNPNYLENKYPERFKKGGETPLLTEINGSNDLPYDPHLLGQTCKRGRRLGNLKVAGEFFYADVFARLPRLFVHEVRRMPWSGRVEIICECEQFDLALDGEDLIMYRVVCMGNGDYKIEKEGL